MGEVSGEELQRLLLVFSSFGAMPWVSLSWGTVSAEFSGHRVRSNYGGPLWRTMQDGDVEVP